MAKGLIKVGEQVVGRIVDAYGRYGTCQAVGKYIGKDADGDYLVEVKDKSWLSGKDVVDTYACSSIRRA